MQTVQAFIEANPALKDELAAQAAAGKTSFTVDDVTAAAEKLGIDASSLAAEEPAADGELSESALAGVTGGGKISLNIGGYTISLYTPW